MYIFPVFIYYVYNCVSQNGIELLQIRFHVSYMRMGNSVILQDSVYKSLGNSYCYVRRCINKVSETQMFILLGIKSKYFIILFIKKAVGKLLDTEKTDMLLITFAWLVLVAYILFYVSETFSPVVTHVLYAC